MNKKSKPGGQPGNQNAARGGKENDGQLLVRLPRERIPRMKSATRITGDGGLNALVRRLIDAEIDRVEGVKVGVIIDQSEAERVLQEAGYEPPKIPSGETTAELWLKTADGHLALALNQTGFARTASDPDPVNGCTVLALIEGELSDEEARRAIREALKQMTQA